MKHTMIVVANSTCARIFVAESSSSPLTEIETMTHTEGRLHARDLTSDLPGKGSGGGTGVATGSGSSRHAYEGKTDPKEHELSEFAKRVADYLDDARKANKISRILLVATPPFLGEVRSNLSAATNKKVVFELDKNLTHNSVDDIRKHLPRYFPH